MNKKSIIVLSIIFLILAVLCVLALLLKRIPANDPNLAGNTGGNLYNDGLFCESEGKVYFANSYDNGCLYSMNSDESDMRKLNNSQVFSINAGGKYLYYCLNSTQSGGSGLGYIRPSLGLYRSKTNGSSSTCLRNNPVITATLCGNYVYYQNYNNKEYTRLYKMKTDKSENIEIADYVINPSSYHNGIIYFAGTQDDHYLYGLNTGNDTISTLLQGNIYNPVYLDGYVYYMDQASNYRLCRYSLAENIIQILTEDRVDTYNVGSGLIYYQKNDTSEPALIRMSIDGSNPEVVAEGNYTKINMTSQYVYFRMFGDDVTTYRTPLYGYPEASIFTSAAEAVSS